MEKNTAENPVQAADFSARVLAFSIDYLLFGAGFLASLKALSPQESVWSNPQGKVWCLVWLALFIAYQAVFSSEGRASLGKRLLGLRVVDLNGEPLGIPKALVRTLGYLPSSLFGAGFLWTFSNPARQGWHDLLAGSVVVDMRGKRAAARRLIQAGAFACLALFAGAFAWEAVLAHRYADTLSLAYAEAGLREIDSLQKLHYLYNKRYSDDVGELAALSMDPKAFLSDVSVLFDTKRGIRIHVTDDSYVLTANARDSRGTEVRHVGRPEDI